MNQIASQPLPEVAQPLNSTATIIACLGQAAATYAENKQRGGASGKKGTRYEDFFLAYKISEIASVRIDGSSTDWPFLQGQAQGFVDDVVLSDENGNYYYQLKNVAQISWSSGKHPIETDFLYQYKLASFQNQVNPTTNLVVSNLALEQSLRETLPLTIKDHTAVIFFPYSDSLNRLVLENQMLHSTLRALSKVENPSIDELVGVLGVLVIGCLNHPNGAKINEILMSANSYIPNQLRATWAIAAPVVLHTSFVKVLAEISGLTYDVHRGFFSWSAFGTSGVFDFDCTDPKFARFQEIVEKNQPTTFDDFEELLP